MDFPVEGRREIIIFLLGSYLPAELMVRTDKSNKKRHLEDPLAMLTRDVSGQ